MSWSIKGKTVVITGATSGIGLATAESLARLGARVVLVGRDRARGEAALARVNAIGDVKAKLFLADLWFTTEVRRLASDLSAALPRVDVLVNNAGAIFRNRQRTAEGFEQTFALNHLATFLLTNLLRSKLEFSRV